MPPKDVGGPLPLVGSRFPAPGAQPSRSASRPFGCQSLPPSPLNGRRPPTRGGVCGGALDTTTRHQGTIAQSDHDVGAPPQQQASGPPGSRTSSASLEPPPVTGEGRLREAGQRAPAQRASRSRRAVPPCYTPTADALSDFSCFVDTIAQKPVDTPRDRGGVRKQYRRPCRTLAADIGPAMGKYGVSGHWRDYPGQFDALTTPDLRDLRRLLTEPRRQPYSKAFNKATKYVVTGSLGQLDWENSQNIGGRR